jgi:hypothetical protein
MEYSITHKRELNEKEKELLHFLFGKEKPEWLSLIDKLKIIARCGCGKCPTVLFGFSFDDEVKTNKNFIIDYSGNGVDGELVGVSLFGNNEMPIELEFYSIDGKKDIGEIPAIKTLKPVITK